MQTKEIKIYGFQCKEANLCLLYQIIGDKKRYIIRRNRKIVRIYNEDEKEELMAKHFGWYCWNELCQQKIYVF